ncbi:DNA primase [Candidatus Woesearchaeota archaeon]|nr:DNA primase [Candidatus Woesearchaeota archaeon]
MPLNACSDIRGFITTGVFNLGKISQVASKYIIHSRIMIEGVVDRPDVIGAIFGQTEGLLGEDLELRELQRSGRIGRIEVKVETKAGKTQGSITVPSSLDKAETAIIGAALEIIQRIGPCNSKIKVDQIEDVRISKRKIVIDRAKELLRNLMDSSLPDSQELADEVAHSVRVMEIMEYGKDRLPAGPAIDESDEIYVVEGRADVINLLKHGIKNSISMNGTNVPQTIIDVSKQKIINVLVDGDRGGDLIIKELMDVAEIDFISKAPDGKEIEELTKKELHKAMRSKISVEQAKLDMSRYGNQQSYQQQRRPMKQNVSSKPTSFVPKSQDKAPVVKLSDNENKIFKDMLEDLIGTRGAYILDDKLNILGKVPISELPATLKSLSSGVSAIVLDGAIDKALMQTVEKADIKYIIGMELKIKKSETKKIVLTASDL